MITQESINLREIRDVSDAMIAHRLHHAPLILTRIDEKSVVVTQYDFLFYMHEDQDAFFNAYRADDEILDMIECGIEFGEFI